MVTKSAGYWMETLMENFNNQQVYKYIYVIIYYISICYILQVCMYVYICI